MKGINRLMVLLALSLVIAFPSSVFAAGIDAITKKLDLTKEQMETFKAQNEKTQKEITVNQAKMKDLGEKLKTELQKDAPDKNAVDNLIAQIGQARTDMQIKRMDSMLELQKILTPQQREKFKKMLEQRGSFGGKWQHRDK